MEASLRITHLVENLERGGLERVVIDLAVEQVALGHEVRVLCLFEEGLLARELRERGIPVLAMGKSGAFDLRCLRALRSGLRNTQLLHTHNAVAHYYGVAAATMLHDVAIVNTRHGMGNVPFDRRREFLFRMALGRTSAAAIVSDCARRWFVEHGIVPARKAHVVPNGIPVATPGPDARARALEALHLPPGPFRIGTVGRLTPVKDHATLLGAFVHVREAIPDAELVLVGGGALRATLEALAETLGVREAVHFCGDRCDVPELLPAFDVFALSSRSEGYSISLLEACAAGLPIVATDVGGNGEIVKPDVNGLLVAPGDPKALAAALVRMGREPAWRAERGRAGREWVCAHGTVAAMARRYMELYRHARR